MRNAMKELMVSTLFYPLWLSVEKHSLGFGGKGRNGGSWIDFSYIGTQS